MNKFEFYLSLIKRWNVYIVITVHSTRIPHFPYNCIYKNIYKNKRGWAQSIKVKSEKCISEMSISKYRYLVKYKLEMH